MHFNYHHKGWLTYSGGTDRSGELCHNCSISNDLTQMVHFPTWIPEYDSRSPAFLDLFFSSDASNCSTMTFPPLGNSDLIVASVSIDFPSNSQQDAPFHCIVYDYSCADWDSLCDHLRDAPWEDIFRLRLLLLLVYFVSGFRLELMHVPHLSIRSSLTHQHGFQLLVQLT